MNPDQVKPFLLAVEDIIHSTYPCTTENQQTWLEAILNNSAEDCLYKFRQETEALKSMMPAPQHQYLALLTDSFEILTAELKLLANWQMVRTSSVAQIAQQLIKTAQTKLLARQMQKWLSGTQPGEFDELEKGWFEFYERVQPDLEMYQTALGKSACIDWLKEEIDANSRITTINNFNMPVNLGLTDDEKKQVVLEILSPLNGYNPQKVKIMDTAEYNRLIEYTTYLILTGTLPENINCISQTSVSTKHIRYTFYRLHTKLFSKVSPHRERFILFLHAVFIQFKGSEMSTTGSKFSDKPNSYYSDFGVKEDSGE